jgi:hypothetical protein
MIRGKWRSAPVAIFGVAILILLAGIAIILQYNVSYGRDRLEQVQGLADILAASEAAPLDFDDPVAAQESVNAFRVNNQMRMVAVYDRNGRAIAGYDRSGSPVPPTIAALPEPGSTALRVSAPVEKAGQRIGTIYFDVDREAGSRRFTRYSLMFVLAFVAALVVTGLGIAQSQLRSANSPGGSPTTSTIFSPSSKDRRTCSAAPTCPNQSDCGSPRPSSRRQITRRP